MWQLSSFNGKPCLCDKNIKITVYHRNYFLLWLCLCAFSLISPFQVFVLPGWKLAEDILLFHLYDQVKWQFNIHIPLECFCVCLYSLSQKGVRYWLYNWDSVFGPHEKRRRNNNMPDLDESKMFCCDGNRKPNLQHLIQHIQYHNLNLVIL